MAWFYDTLKRRLVSDINDHDIDFTNEERYVSLLHITHGFDKDYEALDYRPVHRIEYWYGVLSDVMYDDTDWFNNTIMSGSFTGFNIETGQERKADMTGPEIKTMLLIKDNRFLDFDWFGYRRSFSCLIRVHVCKLDDGVHVFPRFCYPDMSEEQRKNLASSSLPVIDDDVEYARIVPTMKVGVV